MLSTRIRFPYGRSGFSTTETYVSGVVPKVVNNAATLDYTIIRFKGVWKQKDAGEVMPQLTFLTTSTGSRILKTGSFIKFSPVKEKRSFF